MYPRVSEYHSAEKKIMSVMEGDSVTLNTALTEIHRNGLILWIYEQNSDTLIAEIGKQTSIIYDSGENKQFRDRLKTDKQTGSLTITNINKSHSGLYKVQIISKKGVTYKIFIIDVYGLTVPVISDSPQNSKKSSEQKCSLLCSVLNVSHVTLSWYKGNSLLSSISVSDLSISLSLPLEIECLDDSYSCAVTYSFTNQTKHINITDRCQTCSDGPHVSVKLLLIAVFLPLLVVSVLAVLIFCYCRSKRTAHKGCKPTTLSE
ncbi:uncharacterized protein LOC127160521 [Labeo rohita]|uniref:uncharacterized protein LOC127160521 n=1 Tax=Labeo rohita TaxID=84645 RepID=UPI0021E21F87|nr:uncharacterized protein LOC127160521 [Labeo rohita]